MENSLLRSIPKEWETYDALICEPIKVSPLKKIKILKRGWRNLMKDPSIIFNEKKQNLKFQFDVFHGYGYLDLAVDKIKDQNKKESFRNYILANNEFHPHIMVISKKEILQKWFSDLFEWLFDCEETFGFEKLVGYDKLRLYAFLAERYLSFWFSNYYRVKSCPWVFLIQQNSLNNPILKSHFILQNIFWKFVINIYFFKTIISSNNIFTVLYSFFYLIYF